MRATTSSSSTTCPRQTKRPAAAEHAAEPAAKKPARKTKKTTRSTKKPAAEAAPSAEPEPTPEPEPEPEPKKPNIGEIHNLLHIASEKYQDADGFVNVSSSGLYIKRVKPDFNVRAYGYRKLPRAFRKSERVLIRLFNA